MKIIFDEIEEDTIEVLTKVSEFGAETIEILFNDCGFNGETIIKLTVDDTKELYDKLKKELKNHFKLKD